MPNFLALVDRWNPGIYGCSSNECNFIDYFSGSYKTLNDIDGSG